MSRYDDERDDPKRREILKMLRGPKRAKPAPPKAPPLPTLDSDPSAPHRVPPSPRSE